MRLFVMRSDCLPRQHFTLILNDCLIGLLRGFSFVLALALINPLRIEVNSFGKMIHASAPGSPTDPTADVPFLLPPPNLYFNCFVEVAKRTVEHLLQLRLGSSLDDFA